MFDSIIQHIPSGQELVTAIPVIISLIIIEGLLSVDNAMAIAAMASKLPKHQQKLALKLGIIGAYGFRALALLFVAWIANNPWVKIFGALYLIYLMCEHFVQEEEEVDGETGAKVVVAKGLVATILSIELMDLSLSVDNVVAAVALDKRLWVVCTGVFIGILALRFLAGYCITLIEKFPILNHTAFLLVGFVGVILVVELILEFTGIHFHIDAVQKFFGIMVIVAATIWYERSGTGRRVLSPVVAVGRPVLGGLDTVIGWILWPITFPVRRGLDLWKERGLQAEKGASPSTEIIPTDAASRRGEGDLPR